jgi:hypothetical protein
VLKDCSAEGKCNGNRLNMAAEVSGAGVPNAKCVPYFAADDAPCNARCGAPTDPEYYMCNGTTEGASETKCVKPPGLRWTTCADGSELKRVAETYEPRLIRGESAMIQELDQYGPIVCGLNFYRKDGKRAAWTLTEPSTSSSSSSSSSPSTSYSSFVISNGYVSQPSEDGREYSSDISLGGHALVVYGYGTRKSDGVKYWNVRNSWGADWGLYGDSKILRGYTNQIAAGEGTMRGAWGIEDQCFAAKVRPHYNYESGGGGGGGQ